MSGGRVLGQKVVDSLQEKSPLVNGLEVLSLERAKYYHRGFAGALINISAKDIPSASAE